MRGGTVLLFSGGLDSTALAAIQPPDVCLHVDYGQRPARGERTAAAAVARALNLEFETLDIDCSQLGMGLLADSPPATEAPAPEWWPYRNQLLITFAAGWALQRELDTIVTGTVAGDGDRHRDGTGDFYDLIVQLVALQEGGVRVEAPLLTTTTENAIRQAALGLDVLGWTHSCHRDQLACGACPGCHKRDQVLRNLFGDDIT